MELEKNTHGFCTQNKLQNLSKSGTIAVLLWFFIGASSVQAGPVEDNLKHLFKHEPLSQHWQQEQENKPAAWLEGYAEDIDGEKLTYHSHLSLDSAPALLARATDGTSTMAWKTSPVPEKTAGDSVTFLWAGGIGANQGERGFDIFVNDEKRFTVRSRDAASWSVEGAGGGRMDFDAIFKDRHQDYFGYMRLTAPSAWLKPGVPASIRITGHADHSPAFFMVFKDTNAVGYLRGHGKRAIFNKSCVDLRGQGRVLLSLMARPELAGEEVTLAIAGDKLASVRLDARDGLAAGSVAVPLDARLATQPIALTLRNDAVDTIRIDPVTFEAKSLLAEAEPIARLAAEGRVPPAKKRPAAMVLARAELLAGIMTELDEKRLSEIRMRAKNLESARDDLRAALTDYSTESDVYAARRGSLLAAYVSSTDSTGQIYGLNVPEDYDPARPYPLLVWLHGSGGSFQGGDPLKRNPATQPFLLARIDGRGSNSCYVGLGELDIIEVIRDVQAHYNVDPRRIALFGYSMGSWGTWYMLQRHPGLFSAGFATEGPATSGFFRNLWNVPVWYFQDETDFVPADMARALMGHLKSLGNLTLYTEGTGHGHDFPGNYSSLDFRGWLLKQQSDPFPSEVRYTTETPYRGRAYWIEIAAFTDPCRPASVAARVIGRADTRQLYVQMENVDILKLDLPAELFDGVHPLSVLVRDQPLLIKPPLPAAVRLVRNAKGGGYEISPAVAEKPTGPRPFGAAGVDFLYSSGEPLAIVASTHAEAESQSGLDAVARKLSTNVNLQVSSWSQPMPMGSIPIIADQEVTPAIATAKNLILLGPASANHYLARIADRLPAQEKDGALQIGNERYDLAGRSYALFYYNPEAPGRFVLVLSTPDVRSWPAALDRFLNAINPNAPLGLCLVDNDSGGVVRWVAWDKTWQIPANLSAGKQLPKAFRTRESYLNLERQAIRKALGADLLFVQKDTPPPAIFMDTTRACWSDYLAITSVPPPAFVSPLTGSSPIFVSLLTGAAITDIAKAMTAKKTDVEVWPAESLAGLRPEATYRVAFRPGVAWELRKRLENLPNIEWRDLDVAAEVQRLAQ